MLYIWDKICCFLTTLCRCLKVWNYTSVYQGFSTLYHITLFIDQLRFSVMVFTYLKPHLNCTMQSSFFLFSSLFDLTTWFLSPILTKLTLTLFVSVRSEGCKAFTLYPQAQRGGFVCWAVAHWLRMVDEHESLYVHCLKILVKGTQCNAWLL